MLIMSIIGAEVADPSPDPSQFRHNDAPVTDRPPRDSGALWRCLDGLAGRSSKDLDIRQPKNSGFRKRNLLLDLLYQLLTSGGKDLEWRPNRPDKKWT